MGNTYTCDSPAPIANFDVQAYSGMWFNQWHKLDQSFAPDDAKCTQAMYTNLSEDGLSFDVRNSYEEAGSSSGVRKSADGSGNCPEYDGQCFVKFFFIGAWEPNYIVVSTDYTSYSIVYSCDEWSLWESTPSLWILTREPEPKPEDFARYQDIARKSLPNFDFNNMAP